MWSGIEGRQVTGALAALLNVPPPGGGLLVQGIASGSLAERLDLRPSAIPTTIGELEIMLGGDIIMMVQGIQVGGELENMERIIQALASLPDGDEIFITVLRDGELLVLSAPSGR